MFHIGALCPWCLLVTASSTLVFATLNHVNIRDGNLFLPKQTQETLRSAVNSDLDALAVTIWLLVLTLAVVSKHGNTLFG